MPSHWGHKRLNIVSQSSPTGTQCLHAIGCAEAGRLYERITGDRRTRARTFTATRSPTCRIGEGTTSEGEFWESLNTACTLKLPVVFLVEDNGYAISVPVEVQTPGGDISKLVASFPGLLVQSIDGTDFVASYAAMRKAVAYARARKGPALVHAKVIRPYSHSLSDDETAVQDDGGARRRSHARSARAAAASCSRRRASRPRPSSQQIRRDVEREVNAAADQAIAAEKPSPETAQLYVFSPDVDPTSRDVRARAAPDGKPDTMVAAINRTLKDEMAREPAHRRLRRGRRRLQPRERAGARSRARAASSRSRTACSARSAATASSTRRSPRRTSSAAPSAWRRAASSRSSRSSSSTTSGRR